MKKILFGITSLTLGGAERVLVDLANELSQTYEVTIFTIYGNGILEKQLSNKIKLITYMPVAYSALSALKKHMILPLRILLKQKNIYNNYIKGSYDIEIAFLEGPITRLFSTKNANTKKIAWIHNDIAKVFGNGIKAKMKRKIDEKLYSQYETLVFVSKDNLKQFEKTYDKVNCNKKVIYNYINQQLILEKAKEELKEKFDENIFNFVTVARLVPQKGIDRLIRIHSKLIKEGLYHKIYVIGEGPEKEKLQKQIQEENVEDTFKLLGKKENPYPYIKKSDYFCLLSYFEGYGMVLEEAKILNKPIIITNTAAREAVENNKKAIIVENSEQGIYNQLKEILIGSKQEIVEIEADENQDNNQIILKQVKELLEE